MTVDWREMIGGSALGLVGAYFLFHSYGYGIGTPRQMGAGFFPMMLGICSVVVSLLIVIGSFRRSATLPAIAWRPLVAILGAIGVFGLTMPHIGLVPSVALTTVIAASGDSDSRPVETAVLALVVSFGIWLIFIVGLGMPVPAFPGIY